VLLVVVALLPELLPGGLSIFGDHLGGLQLFADALNLLRHFVILVLNVRDHADTAVLKDTFFLQLEPFMLKGVHGLGHLELSQEVANEIIDHHGLLLRFGLLELLARGTKAGLMQ
jgi:hypothetical protein